MRHNLVLDERELAEIHHALYYYKRLHHGTVGHNLLMLVGKMAESVGFQIDDDVLMFDGSDVERELIIGADS